MSGVSTRSHRSSVRGVETTLAELSDLLKANKSIVMITGAGLSAASGTKFAVDILATRRGCSAGK